MQKALDYRKIEKKFKDFKPFSITPNGSLSINFSMKIKGIGNVVDFKLLFLKNQNALSLSHFEFDSLTQIGEGRKATIYSVLKELLFKNDLLSHDLVEDGSIYFANHIDLDRYSRYNSDTSDLYVFEAINSSDFIKIAESQQYQNYYKEREWFSFYYSENEKILALKTNKKANLSSKKLDDFIGIQKLHFSFSKEKNVQFGVDQEGNIFVFKKGIEKKDILLFNLYSSSYKLHGNINLDATLIGDEKFFKERFSLHDVAEQIKSDKDLKEEFEFHQNFNLDNFSLPIITDDFVILHELALGIPSEKIVVGDFVRYNDAIGRITEVGIKNSVLFEGDLEHTSDPLATNILEKVNFSVNYFEKPFLAMFGLFEKEEYQRDSFLSFVNVVGESEKFFYVEMPKYITEKERNLIDFLNSVHRTNNKHYRGIYIPRNTDESSKNHYYFDGVLGEAALFSGKVGVIPIKKEHLKRLSVSDGVSYEFVNNFTDDTKEKLISSIRNFLKAFSNYDYMKLSKHDINTFSILFYFKNFKNDFLNEFHDFSNLLFSFYNDRYSQNDMSFKQFLFHHFRNAVRIYDTLH